MIRGVCNYCTNMSSKLEVVGFMYRHPICYCPSCAERFAKERDKMCEGSHYMVADCGVGNVPILLQVEEFDIKEGVDVNMEDWLKKEKERIEKEREEILKEKGYEKLFRFPVGETKVKLVMAQPKVQEGRSGRKFAVFDIEVNGEKVQTGINLVSPMYREFINRMAEGTLEFSVIRTGTGLDTRYSFK